MNCRDAFGNSALHIAAQANQKEIAVLLIQSGLCPDVKNRKGMKALNHALLWRRLTQKKLKHEVIVLLAHTRHWI